MEQISIPREQARGLATPTMEVGVSNTSTVSADVAHKPSRLYYILKRLFDIALSAIALVVLLPVFLVIAFCIKLDDGGDILYFREVIGQHGKRFFALKFRTMIPDADDYLEQHLDLKQHYLRNVKLIGDPRVTRVGRFLRKTSLDELPQLFNVLVGQMSLVGPRIIHPSELVRYGEFAQKLLAVKPAITGLWQISARQHLSYDERVVLDMRYIDTRSFFRELIIVFKTLRVFIIHTGD